MGNTQSLVRRIHQRSSVVNVDINAKIKHLQRKLVSYSFTGGNHTNEYFQVLGEIRSLRGRIFKGV